MTTRTFTVDVTASGTDHVFRVTGSFYPGDAGQTFGPPERCYPPEPEMLEISGVLLLSTDGNVVLADAIDTELWTALRDEVSQSVFENAKDAMREAYADELERIE